MSREIEVTANDYPDATFSGQTVSITLKHNRNQWNVLTLTPNEAEVMLNALDEYLHTIKEDQP